MGGDTKTTTSSSQSSSPAVRATVDKLASGLGKAYDAGAPAAFGKSMYSPAGATTQQGWQSVLGAANNPTYASGVQGAMSSFADTASGKNFGMNDPGFATLRAKAGNDALQLVGTGFNNSGRFGGGSYTQAAGEGVTNALAGLDYANHQNDIARQERAAAALPSLYNASLLPGTTQGAVGAAQDANQQGVLQGERDLYDRQANNQTDWLAKLTSILGGQAASAGTNQSTTSPTTPWWQSLLGLGIAAL